MVADVKHLGGTPTEMQNSLPRNTYEIYWVNSIASDYLSEDGFLGISR